MNGGGGGGHLDDGICVDQLGEVFPLHLSGLGVAWGGKQAQGRQLSHQLRLHIGKLGDAVQHPGQCMRRCLKS